MKKFESGFSLKFVLKRPCENKPALVQITAWRRTGEKLPYKLSLGFEPIPSCDCLWRPELNPSYWPYHVIITSLLRQNHVAISFWRNDDVIISKCINWDRAARLVQLPGRVWFSACHKAIIWTNAGLFLIGLLRLFAPLGQNELIVVLHYSPHEHMLLNIICCICFRSFCLHRLSEKAIFGIGMGSLPVFIIGFVMCVCCYDKHKKNKRSSGNY